MTKVGCGCFFDINIDVQEQKYLSRHKLRKFISTGAGFGVVLYIAICLYDRYFTEWLVRHLLTHGSNIAMGS